MFPVFERFAGVTDLQALNAFSAKPLRKSMRVNTLKTSVDAFRAWAEEKKWTLTPVPWCAEAFFIDRENRENALGTDLLHLLGHAYMQEAASMLPAELLQPQPGETILDMSAAPGSKTTQIGAKLRGRGAVIANDVQEKRLWTLKSSLHRCGVPNNIVVKKVGQWYARQMTERFDRVLCDAPCTAMGTARKDSDALNYCSVENTEKMARLQVQLLESAIDACAVGGRVVYSTCTLTPEENEGVVLSILEKFKGKVEVVDPREMNNENGEMIFAPGLWRQAIDDSLRMQQSVKEFSHFSSLNSPFLRLWPQTYDTEGFFCAVLTKTASTRDVIPQERAATQERLLSKKQTAEIAQQIAAIYGSSLMLENDRLFQRADLLILANDAVADCSLPVEDYALGIPFAKVLKDGRILIDHETVTLRGGMATESVIELNDEQLGELLDAKDTACDASIRGRVIMRYRGIPVGRGLARDGKLKNNLPRWMVRFG